MTRRSSSSARLFDDVPQTAERTESGSIRLVSPDPESVPLDDPVQQRIDGIEAQRQMLTGAGLYHFFQPVQALDGPWVTVDGQRKLMFATYSYLDLLNHPAISAAAIDAVNRYGTGTHGVRIFGGTLDLHQRHERRIADFVGREAAISYTSGFMTNVATIRALVANGDYVISDKANHASIVDGCRLAHGHVKAFLHNDMQDLEEKLAAVPDGCGKLVVADSVFSMDGDILDLPRTVALCRQYGARLMIDEAHSLGVLGDTGRGIEEHFGMPGAIDVKMGTLSKTIPAVGGFVAGAKDMISYLRHTARGFVFSAAAPPPVAAAALAAFDVIETEGAERRAKLARNVSHLHTGLRAAGFDCGVTETPIIPIMLGTDERALAMTAFCQGNGLFVLPVLYPAVERGRSRLRVNVTAAHSEADIELALTVFIAAGKAIGIIE